MLIKTPTMQLAAAGAFSLLTLAACDSGLVDNDTTGQSSRGSEQTSITSVSKNGEKTPVCHYNQVDDAFYRLDVSPNALASHVAHGDVLFNEDAADIDPSDGDLYCLSVSTSNTIGPKIVFTSQRDVDLKSEIYVMDPDGSNQTRLTFNEVTDTDPVWSPDGSRIAFTSDRDGNNEIYTMNADGSNVTRLTFDAQDDNSPAWSPDGLKIAFGSYRDGNREIYSINADGTGLQRLTNQPYTDELPSWSPDGTKIAFSGNDGIAGTRIWVMDADGSNRTPVTVDPVGFYPHDSGPMWSPDGSKLLFWSVRDSEWDLYTINPDGSNETNITNSAGFGEIVPAWSPDGSEIVFSAIIDGSSEIFTMAADGSNLTQLTDTWGLDSKPDWTDSAPSP